MLKNLSISVLRLHDFRLFLLTRMFVTMALQSQAVIVGWQIYSLTKDPFLLGLAGLTEALPAIACAFSQDISSIQTARIEYILILSAF